MMNPGSWNTETVKIDHLHLSFSQSVFIRIWMSIVLLGNAGENLPSYICQSF